MKKIFLIALTLLTAFESAAQQEYPEVITLQPKVGVNVANVTLGNDDPRIAASFGLEMEYRFSKMLSFSCGAIYSMQGDKATGYDSYYGKVKATEKIDYINFPILMNLYIVKGLSVKTGFQPAVNVLARYKIEAGGESAERSFSDLFGGTVNTFDMSIPFGISYDFGGVVLEGRYNLGLTNMVDNVSVKNSVFQFTVGYKFEL